MSFFYQVEFADGQFILVKSEKVIPAFHIKLDDFYKDSYSASQLIEEAIKVWNKIKQSNIECAEKDLAELKARRPEVVNVSFK